MFDNDYDANKSADREGKGKSAVLRTDNSSFYGPLGQYFAHLCGNIHNHRLLPEEIYLH